MKKQIYDEKNGLSYTLHGDYYLPDLELNEEEPVYGKYGIMRKQFLKEHRSAKYQYLVLTGKLTEHLNQIDKEVREKVEMLVEQMAERWGVTEELKMQDQMEWVRRMNNIQATAEEIAYKNIIFMQERGCLQELWTASCIGGVILQIYHSQWLYQKILYPKWFLQWLVNIRLYVWKYLAPRSEEQYSLGIEAFYHFHNHDYDFARFF